MNSDPRVRVLLVGPRDERAVRLSERLAARGLSPSQVSLDEPVSAFQASAGQLALLMLGCDDAGHQAARAAKLVAKLRAEAVTTFVWGAAGDDAPWSGPGVETLSADVSLDEVVGRLTTLAKYAPLVRCLDEELRHMKRLGKQLNRYISEMDKDMRLAGRLQRDFMPRRLDDMPPLRFGTLFRPAGFVSGDIFDVIRIDETHVGVFMADAMGHGTAAGLITMFLRKALVPREMTGETVRIVSPAEAMELMHEGMASHELPNSNFVTAAYAVIDLRTLALTLARGGHPYPLWIRPDGRITELRAEGGLMGLAELPPEFNESTVHLVPGDKVVFYTDGIESHLIASRDDAETPPQFTPRLRDWAKHDARGFIGALSEFLDTLEGSLHPDDDATVLVVEVAR